MIVSSSILKTALASHQRQQRLKENFSAGSAAESGAAAAFASFTLVVAVLFFLLELVVLFYAINMALVCSKGGPERIVNIVLAITFTLPYVMLNILFNKCAKATLRNNRSFLPSTHRSKR